MKIPSRSRGGIEGIDRVGMGNFRVKGYLKWIAVFIVLVVAIPLFFYIKERRDPDYYLKFQRSGEAYFKKGEWDKAAAEFEKAVKYQPDKVENHYALGLSYLRSNKLQNGVEELTKVIKVSPKNMDAHYSLGVAYQRIGKLELALKEYHIVAKALPNSFQVFNNVGVIQLDTGNYDKAVQALKHAIEIKPDYYQASLNLGKGYEALGEKELARKEYKKIKEMASKRPETLPYVKMAEQRLASLQ